MEQLLTPDVAAEKLAVSVKTIKNLLRSGKLRGVKVGNLWRLQEEAFEEYCKELPTVHKSLMSKTKTTVAQEGPSLQFKTSLGRRLWTIRSRLVLSGRPLPGWEKIEQEISNTR